ncbi:hypothetical protein BDV23DRAFT_147869 [Aspergillus alliaceus]|uniref:Uncharacterized protein n=1 Tax=Petromyces alliaceus TaxID=209559 RepID=A0A5N7CJN2_PETAA|nr:hypothetical protein BDV23DRAFT_147869 [Aspergillus alliaceus]
MLHPSKGRKGCAMISWECQLPRTFIRSLSPHPRDSSSRSQSCIRLLSPPATRIF